jgi:hypothetical protein
MQNNEYLKQILVKIYSFMPELHNLEQTRLLMLV